MIIEKTFFGFKVKDFWDKDIKIYKLFSQKIEYDINFKGQVVAKIKVDLEKKESSIRIIYSREIILPEIEIAELGINIIDLIKKIN